jgi:hypothetical protein
LLPAHYVFSDDLTKVLLIDSALFAKKERRDSMTAERLSLLTSRRRSATASFSAMDCALGSSAADAVSSALLAPGAGCLGARIAHG